MNLILEKLESIESCIFISNFKKNTTFL